MHLLSDLRKYLGVTQQSLADYLGISRSLLSMAEVQERHLPPEAIYRLYELNDGLQMHESLEKLTTKMKADLENEKQELHHLLQMRQKTLAFQATQLKEKITRMEIKRAQLLRGKHSLQAAAENRFHRGENKSDLQRLWISIQQREIEKRLEKVSLKRIEPQKVKLKLLEEEIHLINDLMGNSV